MMEEQYKANSERYTNGMQYRKCGNSGLILPAISLGLWHNFGSYDRFENARAMTRAAFDRGITHFDLANNYGPVFGSAEENFGKILEKDFKSHRNEMVITTKAGHLMWPGPYGDGGSRKYLMSSLDDSLRRMNLDYVDIFYIHRYTPETPLEETMQALVDIVKQGKALYVGISKYPADAMEKAYAYLRERDIRCLVEQDRYSMFDRKVENGILSTAAANGAGFVAFSPLAQGLLTDRYLNGIPEGSRASRPEAFLKANQVSEELVNKSRALNEIASRRGQTLSQMAIAWVLRLPEVTSAIIGASSVDQLNINLDALHNLTFSSEELKAIEDILQA
ncbi:MAG: aldo/keto reductase [Bacteroidales bacterium]